MKWLICKWKGHKRGVRVGMAPGTDHSIYVFRCPRCGEEWWRKAAERKAKTATVRVAA